MSIVRVVFDPTKPLPPLTDAEKEMIRNASSEPTPDCPALTKEQLARLHRAREGKYPHRVTKAAFVVE